jgi:hypothetical protein
VSAKRLEGQQRDWNVALMSPPEKEKSASEFSGKKDGTFRRKRYQS